MIRDSRGTTDRVVSPRCPGCHQPPMLMVDADRALCGSPDCPVAMWDRSVDGRDDPAGKTAGERPAAPGPL